MIRNLVLFVLLAGSAGAATAPEGRAAVRPSMAPDGPRSAPLDTVPAAVLRAAEQGRYWRASRLMEDHLATTPEPDPATLLTAARMSAGWGDWERVSELLEGRDWLDRVESGAGWELVGRSRIELGRRVEGARALARYLELTDPGDRVAGVTELRRALALAEEDRPEAAAEAFDRARRLIPWFADRTSLMAADAAAASGDTAGVRRRLAEAGNLAGDRAWRLRAQAAREAGDTMAAREVALETARTSPSSSVRSAAWAALGRMRLSAGDTARARTAFLEAMETIGASGAVDGARALTELDPSPAEHLRIAEIYDRHGNARRAARGYALYLESGGGTPEERLRLRLELGQARFSAGEYDRAERELLALAEEEVPGWLGAQALYLAGRAQYRQGRSDEGQRTLARLSDAFPGQRATSRGLYLLADLKHDDGELDDARRWYRAAVEAWPDLNEAGLALMRLGGLAFLDEDYEAAAGIFAEYRSRHPEGRRTGQATYWLARSEQELGRAARADSLLRQLRADEPISYYGVLAAEQLGVGVLDMPMGAGPGRDPAADSAVAAGLRRVDVLAALGRRGELVDEVERLRARFEARPAAAYALAEALSQRGHTLTAIGMGWDLYRRTREWNRRLLTIIYPFPYRGLVIPEARERGLDPYLVAGLIRRESAFNPTVTSGAGAIGLMQIMPETGRQLARGVRLDGFEPELLKQPEVNVHLGTRYLAEMLERFDGDLPVVLSAYNAGPTRARRWTSLPEARDPLLFTERVPYNETRIYIRNVVLHRAVYRALYPDVTPAEAPAG